MKLIPILCLLSCLGLAQPASAQIKLNKLKKTKNELLKAKQPKPATATRTKTKSKSSDKKTAPTATFEPTQQDYSGPAKNEYQTLQNRLKLVAKYVQKLETATSDYQRGDAESSAKRYLDKVEADLKVVAGLDPALDIGAEQKAFTQYTKAYSKAISAGEQASSAKANDGQRVFNANQFVESMLGLLKYGKEAKVGEPYTYQTLQNLLNDRSIKGNQVFIFRRNMEELATLLESTNLSSWFSDIRQDVNNYQVAKQFEEAEELLAYLEPTVNFLAAAAPNFSRLKKDADYLIQSYRKKGQERAAGVATGDFHLEHLNQLLLSNQAIQAGQEQAGQFKTHFKDTEPIRVVLYLDRKLKDLTNQYGYVPIDLFIDDPNMGNGCVLQYSYSWATYLDELENGYLLLDIIPDWHDFQPRHKAIGPESFARCFAGLTPGEHEIIIKLGLTSGSGWGKIFKTSFSLEITEAGLARYAALQTELEGARKWAEKHQANPMRDAATEQGLLKSLEAQVPGAKATKAVIRDLDWTYVRDRHTANTLGKRVAAEVFYTQADGQCYGYRVYAYYKALARNEYVDQVEAQLIGKAYRVDCR
ncbi:MAG: hypothetical protein KTR30_08605 [Saprospiraceae bacterium]|nr:hypothetical protein [Saprospiraceae bacterium]